MKILLIGSGGREHALAHGLAASPLCERLFIAPGNPGTAALGENRDCRFRSRGDARLLRRTGDRSRRDRPGSAAGRWGLSSTA